MLKYSGKRDLISVLIDPSDGIPGRPQSQFIHFNNETNIIVTEHNFALNDKNILFRIINKEQIYCICKLREMLSIIYKFFVSNL
jgi:hypothetical protein